MEAEVGAQVATPPVFRRFHEAAPPPPLAKKRDAPWKTRGGGQQDTQPPNERNWNPKVWNWDGVRFTAMPVQLEKVGAALDMGEPESLRLNLGGGGHAATEQQQPAPRTGKRVRLGSPGSGFSSPMCQVDDCRAELSAAKDYHRRHKVCENHSKATKAVVAKQMQRFCQQCSRFHPLSEFDEGKRSCRRRLAGHNRRRRKTQPEEAPSKLLPTGVQGSNGNGEVEVANLLLALTRLQGNGTDKLAGAPALPGRERVIEILSKMNSLPANNSGRAAAAPTGLELNASQVYQSCSSEPASKMNGKATAPSTMDLLAVLSSAHAISTPDSLATPSQGSSGEISGDDRTRITSVETAADVTSHNNSTQNFPSVGEMMHHHALVSQLGIPKHPVREVRSTLPFQLFRCDDDENLQKIDAVRKYLSSESSNPMDDRSPSCSPVTQKLFPIDSVMGSRKDERPIIGREDDNGTVEASTSYGWSAPLDFFKESTRRAENGCVQNIQYQAGYSGKGCVQNIQYQAGYSGKGCVQNIQYQAGYTSSSGSDHSPSSSNSDGQDRTGRILFKLFDKDPSNLPGSLRNEIFNWLSNSPSEMESYIRPGCLVLSVYVSMPFLAWNELEKDLLQRVSSLVHSLESEFWRSGRFLVQTSRQLASHKDGKIRLCKSWKTLGAPELNSVSPLAVVSGQETCLSLRGRNLTVPGTKIHCTHMGGYKSKEVLGSVYPGTVYDNYSFESFSFPGGFPNGFGRCFIEVENGFKGNSFPVIIADASICQELRSLEPEFEADRGNTDIMSEGQVLPRSRDDAFHFLNELGWLFQQNKAFINNAYVDFACTRFKFLLLFSVERDWSAVVRTLVDILVERSLNGEHQLRESIDMMLEIQLLNRAVKRKCRKMIDLLLNYSVKVDNDGSKVYLFPPNSSGPGGLTPLHIAASMLDAEDIVDMMTNDPQEISLKCWNLMKDDSGETPYMHASKRSCHSYNRLVAMKLIDRYNGQVSIRIGNEESLLDKSWIVNELEKPVMQPMTVRSCAQCAIMGSGRIRLRLRNQGLLQRSFIVSMLAVAAVCACVCIFYRGFPMLGAVPPFKWENVDFGPS